MDACGARMLHNDASDSVRGPALHVEASLERFTFPRLHEPGTKCEPVFTGA